MLVITCMHVNYFLWVDHENVRSELTSITGQLDGILCNLNAAKKATYNK